MDGRRSPHPRPLSLPLSTPTQGEGRPHPSRGHPRPGVGAGRWLLAAVLASAFTSCGSPEEKTENVRPIDVPPLLTVDTEQDVQEVHRPPELVGVLPGDFPADLPLYAPSSLVDFGDTEDGQRYVALLSPHGRSRVAGAMETQLLTHGWALEPGPSGSLWLRKGETRLRLVYADAGPGCEYRIEY